VDEREHVRANDVDDERVRDPRFDEPARLKQRRERERFPTLQPYLA
jgi:hypothetical protein